MSENGYGRLGKLPSASVPRGFLTRLPRRGLKLTPHGRRNASWNYFDTDSTIRRLPSILATLRATAGGPPRSRKTPNGPLKLPLSAKETEKWHQMMEEDIVKALTCLTGPSRSSSDTTAGSTSQSTSSG